MNFLETFLISSELIRRSAPSVSRDQANRYALVPALTLLGTPYTPWILLQEMKNSVVEKQNLQEKLAKPRIDVAQFVGSIDNALATKALSDSDAVAFLSVTCSNEQLNALRDSAEKSKKTEILRVLDKAQKSIEQKPSK